MRQLFVLIFFALSFICQGQTKVYQDIDFKVTKEIKGLLYFKLDTTLVTGRVILYNKKKVAKKFIIVRNGKPDVSGWIYFREKYESPKESAFGSLVAFAAKSTAVVMDISGNDIDVPIPINQTNTDIKSIIQNDVTDILNYNKENAAKANGDMLQRNEISKNIISISEKRNEFYENNDKDDQLEIKVNYIDVKKNGTWERFYSNGNLESKGNYIEGKKDGIWEEYYENGQLKRKINFKKGKEDGVSKQYHPNSKPWSEGHYKDGRMIGEWTYYDENGKLHLTENYDN